MNYEKIRLKPNQFLSLTSLNVEEFDELLLIFSEVWEKFITKRRFNGKVRQRKYAPHSEPLLPTLESKLFFILVYLKMNPIQEYHAACFDMSRDMCNKFIYLLTPMLDASLSQYKASRNADAMQAQLAEGDTCLLDATERPIERPKSEQKEHYSGKKKTHTVKNLLLCSLAGFVLFVSTTVEGKQHDKKIADNQLQFSKAVSIEADLGFQGFESENATVNLPHKKPRNGELTKIQKRENKLQASKRVTVEHIIGKIKVMRIVKEINRNKKQGYRDVVFNIAAALYNFKHIKRKTIFL
jgi:hypothetical protein